MADGLPPPEVGPMPDQAAIAQAVAESRFAKPVEITDVIRAPSSSMDPWIVCIRSATSDEARRLTYTAFFGKDAYGKDGKYVRSRYSVFADNCATQDYHPFVAPITPSASPSPSPTPEPKKHHKHQQ
jgi:hypothetical protein